MDYTGYASNLSAKTRMYIERNGGQEQKVNYALIAYSKGSPVYTGGVKLGNKIDQAFERVMQGVKHE